MKKSKLVTLICAIVLVIAVGALAVTKIASVGPFKEKTKEASEDTIVKENTPRTSANGIATNDDGKMRDDLTSLEVVDLMGNGINLGNTMEAYGHAEKGITADVSTYETLWGQPVTTQAMIDAMKKAGFDSLRIPVAWTNMMDFENGDYTINTKYLDRVEEIINYALNNKMYVVVNDHWDGGWYGMFGSSDSKVRDQAMELYKSMWTQIATRYKDYSDYLIFEAANEELGTSLNSDTLCKTSGSLSEAECYEVTNKINQTFVDVVRGTGGNNEKRFLLIAGFNTDITNTCDDRFKMPTDTAKDKLLLSVHYYVPDGYCINTSLSKWGTKTDYKNQNEALAKMTKFTEQGYGVVIGEYSVALKSDTEVKENTADWIGNFLNNCDQYGYCPMLWDCSSLFKRTELSFFDKDIAALYTAHSLETQASKSKEQIVSDAKAEIEKVAAAAPDAEGSDIGDDTALAWLMFNSSDWGVSYSVGDKYDPSTKTEGIKATDVKINGAGTYTVSLDFTETAAKSANSIIFSAVGITNGEKLYPGYILTIKEVTINGKKQTLTGASYTTTDDDVCTRANIYNNWVTLIPKNARTIDGDVSKITPNLVDPKKIGEIKTISVTFDYSKPKSK
ncbi:MAG: glycoside hydrolase family 5 protein [bacterium]|nr:glycoside hydrolase family 5 protein [bacterium]